MDTHIPQNTNQTVTASGSTQRTACSIWHMAPNSSMENVGRTIRASLKLTHKHTADAACEVSWQERNHTNPRPRCPSSLATFQRHEQLHNPPPTLTNSISIPPASREGTGRYGGHIPSKQTDPNHWCVHTRKKQWPQLFRACVISQFGPIHSQCRTYIKPKVSATPSMASVCKSTSRVPP